MGRDGSEYSALTTVLMIPACVTIALKSLTLMPMCIFCSTRNSPNSSVSTAIDVCSGVFSISE